MAVPWQQGCEQLTILHPQAGSTEGSAYAQLPSNLFSGSHQWSGATHILGGSSYLNLI